VTIMKGDAFRIKKVARKYHCDVWFKGDYVDFVRSKKEGGLSCISGEELFSLINDMRKLGYKLREIWADDLWYLHIAFVKEN